MSTHPNQRRDEEPSLLIGLELNEGLSKEHVQDLHSKISRVAYDSMQEQGLVDLIHMLDDDQEGVVAYLRDETEPFYVRVQGKKKGFFARLFS